MKLSLRKARKLEDKIQKFLDKEGIKLSHRVRSKSSIKDVEKELKKARKEFSQNLEKRQALSSLRYDLRRLIAESNEKLGVNGLITQKASLEAQLREVNELLAQAEVAKEGALLADALELAKKKLEKGAEESYRVKDYTQLEVSLVTKDQLEALKEKRHQLVKAVEEIEDDLLEKNAGSKINLKAEMVSLLQKEKIL